ncbi:uncharacterized protein LOC112588522 [Harpegnathos saltator]|uniref:uncharacterized protein LOC112588522 n=1 Tax=Harpegnathos saltator TaxID=610380 RepID=UPI000DBED4DE|nr:uncharacterized protein LOC112588522 [Harpegnathos saltator]
MSHSIREIIFSNVHLFSVRHNVSTLQRRGSTTPRASRERLTMDVDEDFLLVLKSSFDMLKDSRTRSYGEKLRERSRAFEHRAWADYFAISSTHKAQKPTKLNTLEKILSSYDKAVQLHWIYTKEEEEYPILLLMLQQFLGSWKKLRLKSYWTTYLYYYL